MTNGEIALRLIELWVDRKSNSLDISSNDILEKYKYFLSEISKREDSDYIKACRKKGIL